MKLKVSPPARRNAARLFAFKLQRLLLRIVFLNAGWLAGCGQTAVAHHEIASPCEDVQASRLLSPQEQTVDSGAVEFLIEAASAPGTSNRIRFRLRNISDQPLWVNPRMLAGSPIGEVSVQAAPSTIGRPLDADCRQEPAAPRYVLLTPGSEISVVSSLGCLEFPMEGPWRVTATYQDRKRRVPPPPPGAIWFAGKAASNELEFFAKPVAGAHLLNSGTLQ